MDTNAPPKPRRVLHWISWLLLTAGSCGVNAAAWVSGDAAILCILGGFGLAAFAFAAILTRPNEFRPAIGLTLHVLRLIGASVAADAVTFGIGTVTYMSISGKDIGFDLGVTLGNVGIPAFLAGTILAGAIQWTILLQRRKATPPTSPATDPTPLPPR